MRNLKRALSLALASVMLMGMMVVGSSAASFPDVDDEDNIEAIDVLETVEVMIGNEKGDFEPDKDVTRAEMAVVMAKLLNYDYDYYVTSCPFNDVPDWAKGYVGACAANGIVSGRGEGVYDPDATVTAVEAASMMMRALGYFQNSGDYNGGFEASTVKQASQISLFSGINGNANDPLNRNQVAKLALNTLQSNMVDFTGDMGFEINGVNVGYRSEYTYRTGTDAKYRAIGTLGTTTSGTGAINQYYVQLGEQLYSGDLKKSNNFNSNLDSSDGFGRPATTWSYKTEKIGTYADDADFTYTTAIGGDTPADKVKTMGLKGLTWDGVYYENGVSASCTGSDSAERLGKLASDVADDGVLVEVFMDPDRANTIGTVTVIRTQMMQVNTVNSKEVTLKKLDNTRTPGGNVDMDGAGTRTSGFYDVRTVKADDDCFDVLQDLKKDDYVLIVPVRDGSTFKVAQAEVPESITGVLTKITTKSSNTKIASVTLDGETYTMSYAWTAADNKLVVGTKLDGKKDSTVYLDTYGNAIYVKDVEASNDVIIVDRVYSGIVDGEIVTYLQGWDIDGEEVSLNLGSGISGTIPVASLSFDDIQGTVWEYTTAGVTGNADYKLVARGTTVSNYTGTARVYAPAEYASTGTGQWIKNGQFNAHVTARNTGADQSFTGAASATATIPMASDVKFIYLTTDSGKGSDVTGISIYEGARAVGEDNGTGGSAAANQYDSTGATAEQDDLENISYILNSDRTKVIAVVIDNDNGAAVTENLIYVHEVKGTSNNDKERTHFKAYDAEGNLMDDGDSILNKKDASINNTFRTYAENGDGTYTLTSYTQTNKTTSVKVSQTINSAAISGDYFKGQGRNSSADLMNAKDAIFVDLVTDDDLYIDSFTAMKDAIKDGKATDFTIAYIYNGGDNSNMNKVSTVFVTAETLAGTPSGGGGGDSTMPDGISDVNISTPATVTITYTKDANSGNRPTNDKAAQAIVAKLTADGWTVNNADVKISSTKIEVKATKSGTYTQEDTFIFNTTAASTSYLVKFTVGTTEITNAITDTTDLEHVTGIAADGSWYVQKKTSATDANPTYTKDKTEKVKAGMIYSAAADGKYYKVSAAANASAGSNDGITFSYGALAETYKKSNETVSITVSGSGTATTGSKSVTIGFGGSTGTTPTTSTTITTPTGAGQSFTDTPIVVGLGSPTVADIVIVIVLS